MHSPGRASATLWAHERLEPLRFSAKHNAYSIPANRPLVLEGTLPESPPATGAQRVPTRDAEAVRGRKLMAVVLVAVVIVGPLLVVLSFQTPWEEAVLAQGRTYIDVPLTTLYTAPNRAGETVNTSVEVSYLSGFWSDNHSAVGPPSIVYRWSSVSGTDLPVRFVMGPSFPVDRRSQFGDIKGDWFWFYPAGGMPRLSESRLLSPLNVSAVGPGNRSVAVTKWAMDYTVRKMAVLQGLMRTNFLEVDYSLTVVNRGFVLPLSDSNVTSPAPADLVASGSPLLVSPGRPIVINGNRFSRDSRSPFTTYEPFYYNLTRIRLDAGSAGVLRVGLNSMNAWLAVCEHAQPPCWFQADYWLQLSTSNSPLWFQVYVDRRFGSLLIEYVPAPEA